MTVSLSNSLAGLSMLSGSNDLFAQVNADTAPLESKAVRIAKAQFTLPATIPPWKQAKTTTPVSTQVSAIQALKTIIDKPATGSDLLPTDVQTAFTTYKALDRLNTLATFAAAKTTSDGQRKLLEASFAKGLGDLRAYLAQAPRDKLELDFGLPSRRAESVKVPSSTVNSLTFPPVASARDAAIPGLSGNEVFNITLSKPGATDTVTVDLSQSTQPPTLDSVSQAINAAIQSIPQRNPDGTLYVDSKGVTPPRWLVKLTPEKAPGTATAGGQWGLKLDSPNGLDQLSIDQANAPSSLMVATGQTALDAPTATSIFRFDDPTGTMQQVNGATIAAFDSDATARAKLLPAPAHTVTLKNVARPSDDVAAPTDAKAIATDAQGFSYVVGTTSGDLGSDKIAGSSDMFLTKLDSEGKVVWQHELGAAGSAQGAAVQVAADGTVTVAGTVNGAFDGSSTDGDMLVARFSANGDQQFATVVRQTGTEQANALAVGSDGSIYVGGKSGNGSGDAMIAKLDSTGKLVARRTIDAGGSESIGSLAIDGSGNLLALSNENGQAVVRKIDGTNLANDLGSINLGTADARVLAVAADGTIAVGGATRAPLSGAQANATSGGRDGFVTRLNSNLSGATTTYLGTGADDQVDSIAFMGGQIYAGGRTQGALGGALTGSTDGFVAQIDSGTGSVASVHQFGQKALRTEPVRVSAVTGGDTVLGALGLHRGTLNPTPSPLLTTQTTLRAGDEFSMKVDGKDIKKFTILADDTMDSLMKRIKSYAGTKATVSTLTLSGSTTLRIEAKDGSPVELVAGANGKDALAKLGIAPQRLTVPHLVKSGEPKVSPGGNFSLALDIAMNLSTAADAAAALGKLKSAISTSQTGYRSMYWDDGKAKLVDGAKPSSTNPIIAAQLKNYQAALTRLTNGPDATIGF